MEFLSEKVSMLVFAADHSVKRSSLYLFIYT